MTYISPEIQRVIDWYSERGGKYQGDSAPSYDPESETWEVIENTGNHEIRYRGLQIFVREELESPAANLIVQFLLDIDRFDEDGTVTKLTNKAIKKLGPLLPQPAKLQYEGTEIWLDRWLDEQDIESTKLSEILSSLTSFAELAATELSIVSLAPEFKPKTQA